MTDYAIQIGNVRGLSARLVTCWTGAWYVDVDLDPDSAPVTAADVPTGAVDVTITPPGGTPIVLSGKVDPTSAGRFVSSVPVRVIAGGGWAVTGHAQAWHSDAGISSVTVETAVAAAVGETVNDPAPVLIGIDWSLMASSPASEVFGGRSWYVDTSGVTQVGTRPPASPDPTLEILAWDPMNQHGTLAGDALVLPGTVLTDPRFDGPITVRDVVQTWDHAGTRVEIWCDATPRTRLVSMLRAMTHALGGIAHLKRYRYRIVSQSADGRLTLQAVANPDGSPSNAPDVTPLSVAPGMSGLSALYALSSECTVAFVAGDPAQAFVESFDSASLPQEVTIDATGIVHVGPSATVKLSEGAPDYAGAPVGGVGDSVIVMLPPACPVTGTMTIGGVPTPFVAVMTVTQPCVGSIMTGASHVLRSVAWPILLLLLLLELLK
jgi:hypothetical protein